MLDSVVNVQRKRERERKKGGGGGLETLNLIPVEDSF